MADVWPPATTVTSTVPVPTGETAVIELSPLTRNEVAGVDPKFTAVTLLKLEPAIVTWVPPPAGPPAGLAVVVRPATTGGPT